MYSSQQLFLDKLYSLPNSLKGSLYVCNTFHKYYRRMCDERIEYGIIGLKVGLYGI